MDTHEKIKAQLIKELQELQRANDALLQTAIKILPVGLWIFNAEGKIVISSAAAQQIWAGVRYVNVDQLGEYKGWRTDSGKLIEAHEWAGARALEKGETSIEEEVEIECFDGTHKIILDTAIPLRKSDGSIGGAITINQDITENKRSQEALKESEEKYRTIFESAVIGIYRTSVDGRILFANPALVKMLGYDTFENLAQRNLEKDGFEHEYQRSEFREHLERNGYVIGLESVWKKNDGTTVFIRENAKAFHDGAGNVLYYDGTVEDITERKRVEQELIRANEELVFQNEEKEKRAAELILANKELVFQNDEKEKRAAELVIANKELAFQNEEKEKRTIELIQAKEEVEQT
ncbi:MAG: PAS domain-containing protein, partial [Bacteroidales bacterium]